MDGYRDLHRALSAGHYASARYPGGYGVERRGSYDPLYSVYVRGALDAYGAYGSTAAYQPSEHPYFVSPRRRANPKRRPPPQSSGKQRTATVQMLTPKKKPLKKTQKGLQIAKVKPASKVQEAAGTPKKEGGSILAKETKDLHKLFRTGVDSGIKIVNPKGASGDSGKTASANGAGKKRKADAKKGSPLKKKDKFKKKKFAKAKKQETRVAEKLAEEAKVPLTEEEEKLIELELDLQRTACKSFADVFWIPVKTAVSELEPEKNDSAETDGANDKADTTGNEKTLAEALKPSPKLKLTPEMFKEIEEKALNFFSKILAENNELSKLYMSKKDAGTFECLVCHSTKPETSKRFSNVAALVSHTIMRRQRRPEHRGFGKAICHIFGWEDFKPKRPIKQAVLDGEKLEEVELGKVEEKREKILQAVLDGEKLEKVDVGMVEEENEGTEADEEK